jgi:ribosome maturation protein Sdo1
LTEDLSRKEIEVRAKSEYSQKTINELKRDGEIMKGEMKSKSLELSEK